MERWLLALGLAAVLPACQGYEPKTADDAEHGSMGVVPPAGDEPVATEQLQPITIVGYTTSELLEAYERARSRLLSGNHEAAAESFDRLWRVAEDARIRSMAMYYAGIAHADDGRREVALKRFRRVVDDHADQPVAKNARVQVARALGYLERWDALEKAARDLLALEDLPVMDRIEAWGALALAEVERGNVEQARVAAGKARALIDRHGFGRAGSPPVQLAQVAFAEGEIMRIESEKIALTPVPPNFGAVLEARCQGLLDAQSAYTEAMRSRDAHWSAMAGFRVGQLYHQLHREAMEIPPPENADPDREALFAAAMRLRYRILLEKGLRMMDGVVDMAERTGESSAWVARAREAKKVLERSLEAEQAALDAVPYSEAEIQAALDKLRGEPANPDARKP